MYDSAGNVRQIDVVGDLTCDGVVDETDQAALDLLLEDPTAYAAAYPDCTAALGDVDGDNDVDEDDMEAFKSLVGLSTPQAVRLSYDAENPGAPGLTQAWRFDGSNVQIWYDALGRRIVTAQTDAALSTTFIMHLYDGLTPVAEYEWNFLVGEWELAREFLWGDWFPEPLVMIDHTAAGDVGAGVPETLYYVHDALGSVVGLLNDPNSLEPNSPGGGAGIPARLVERYDYDPYGTTYISCRQGQTFVSCETSRYGAPFLWTAQRYDAAVGLYHFLFRTYSPTLGRWMQRDPLGYVDGVSLYQYALSSPVRFLDPLGLDACEKERADRDAASRALQEAQEATEEARAKVGALASRLEDLDDYLDDLNDAFGRLTGAPLTLRRAGRIALAIAGVAVSILEKIVSLTPVGRFVSPVLSPASNTLLGIAIADILQELYGALLAPSVANRMARDPTYAAEVNGLAGAITDTLNRISAIVAEMQSIATAAAARWNDAVSRFKAADLMLFICENKNPGGEDMSKCLGTPSTP